ncbi:hypothetical protein V6N12_029403 [Hibiscus sabdariffa]|uniref:DOG1 domain-containing protein n=1 Tax=Hibiscus sabdariffa TaxID=183260 RepID=A0ABR2CW07_9ROSI
MHDSSTQSKVESPLPFLKSLSDSTLTHVTSIKTFLLLLLPLHAAVPMKSQAGERFSEFYDKWICQLDVYLQQLLNVSKETAVIPTEADKQALVSKLTTHYKEYYTVKWAAAHEDVLAFYCPVWLSKLENAYSWLTGWKPSMIFGMVESMRRARVPGGTGLGLAELTEEQEDSGAGPDGQADKERAGGGGAGGWVGGGGGEGDAGGAGEGDESGGLCEAEDLERSSRRAESISVPGFPRRNLHAADSAQEMGTETGHPKGWSGYTRVAQ